MTVKGTTEKVVDGVGPRKREHNRPVRKGGERTAGEVEGTQGKEGETRKGKKVG